MITGGLKQTFQIYTVEELLGFVQEGNEIKTNSSEEKNRMR